MNAQELANKLNGREYGEEITRAEQDEAKAAGLVVVFGYSDDNMEIRGAAHDELSCYDGGEAYFTPDGLLENDCDNDDCPHFQRLKGKAVAVRAQWDTLGYSWIYHAPFPHATFDVMEDGGTYCRGIVFALADVGK